MFIYCVCVVCSRSSRHSGHKGSALAIAAEYKRRKQAGELSPREAVRASNMTKRINEPEHVHAHRPSRHRKSEVHCLYTMYMYTVHESSRL